MTDTLVYSAHFNLDVNWGIDWASTDMKPHPSKRLAPWAVENFRHPPSFRSQASFTSFTGAETATSRPHLTAFTTNMLTAYFYISCECDIKVHSRPHCTCVSIFACQHILYLGN